MSVEWTVGLKCTDCGALVRYKNERPPWQTREPDPKFIEAAKRWVADNPDFKALSVRWWTESFPEEYVSIGLTGPRVAPPASYDYVPCPACDGEARPVEQD